MELESGIIIIFMLASVVSFLFRGEKRVSNIGITLLKL